MKKHKTILLLTLITILGAFLRLNNFLISPPGFHIDESDIGYQAYSLLKTGRDYYGNFLPVHPQSFTDRRPFLYMYTITPFIAVFGLNEFSIRFPPAIFGILTIPVIFLLAQNLYYTKDTKTSSIFALCSSFIISILPWHIHYSRVGYELTFMLLLLILGLIFFTKWQNGGKIWHLSLAFLFLISTIYVYSTAKLFIPLLLIGLFLINKDKVLSLSRPRLLFLTTLVLILLLPLIKDTLAGVGKERFLILSVFTDKNGLSEYMHYRWLSSYTNSYFPLNFIHPQTISKIFLNDWASIIYRVTYAYLSPFTLQFLVFSGDPNPRHTIPASGVAGFAITSLFLMGLVKLLIEKTTQLKKITLLLIISPIASSITRDGMFHATRLFFFILPLVLLSSYGLFSSITQPKSLFKLLMAVIIFVTILWEISRDQFIRLTVYPISGYSSYNYGWKELAAKVEQYSKEYEYIIIDDSEGAPIQTLYAFFHKIDPTTFQIFSNSSKEQYSNDNVRFRPIDLSSISNSLDKNRLLIIDKEILLKNSLTVDKLKKVEIKDVIKSPVGEDIIYLLVAKGRESSQLQN